MVRFIFEAKSESDTDRLGVALAESLPEGTTIALCGTLGAGKTRLTQALATACGIARENVTSPTFVLCQTYHGTRSIYHLDAYRIHDDDEFLQLGPEEYFESSGLTVLEWADRVENCLPSERLEIRIEVVSETGRTFYITARGDRLQSVIRQIDSRLSQ